MADAVSQTSLTNRKSGRSFCIRARPRKSNGKPAMTDAEIIDAIEKFSNEISALPCRVDEMEPRA